MKILGYDYVIVQDGLSDDIGANGRCHINRQRIQVPSDLAPQQLTSTILHEIIEALNYHLELGLEHRVRMSLEAALYQTLTAAGVDLEVLRKWVGVPVEAAGG